MPTAPASETSTMRARVSAQLGDAPGEPLPEVWLFPLPADECPLADPPDELSGTRATSASAQTAEKARTVTPSLVRVNR
jgi:hypothetical protein